MSDMYAVRCSPLTGKIHAGKVDRARKAFTDKTDVIGLALEAVAQWALHHYDGSATVKVAGLVLDIKVRNNDHQEAGRDQ